MPVPKTKHFCSQARGRSSSPTLTIEHWKGCEVGLDVWSCAWASSMNLWPPLCHCCRCDPVNGSLQKRTELFPVPKWLGCGGYAEWKVVIKMSYIMASDKPRSRQPASSGNQTGHPQESYYRAIGCAYWINLAVMLQPVFISFWVIIGD
jgi:hypothetical protein